MEIIKGKYSSIGLRIAQRLLNVLHDEMAHDEKITETILDEVLHVTKKHALALENFHYQKFLDKCYSLYKKDWCRERSIHPENMNEEIGINGGDCYVCRAEFEDAEFRSEEYMAVILNESDFAVWKLVESASTEILKCAICGVEQGDFEPCFEFFKNNGNENDENLFICEACKEKMKQGAIYCAQCERKMLWECPPNSGNFIGSSVFIQSSICRDCQEENCRNTDSYCAGAID